MKKILLILLVFMTAISCKTTGIDFTKSDLNSISLYDINSQPTTVEEITKNWNERIQKNEKINARITKLEIANLTDQKTNKSELVLLGNTNRNSVKTATKLTKLKNGLKLSAITVSCKNCEGSGLSLGLNNGDWFCINDVKRDNCTKTVTLRSVNEH